MQNMTKMCEKIWLVSYKKLPPKNNRINCYDNQELNLHSHNWCEGLGEAEAE